MKGLWRSKPTKKFSLPEPLATGIGCWPSGLGLVVCPPPDRQYVTREWAFRQPDIHCTCFTAPGWSLPVSRRLQAAHAVQGWHQGKQIRSDVEEGA